MGNLLKFIGIALLYVLHVYTPIMAILMFILWVVGASSLLWPISIILILLDITYKIVMFIIMYIKHKREGG